MKVQTNVFDTCTRPYTTILLAGNLLFWTIWLFCSVNAICSKKLLHLSPWNWFCERQFKTPYIFLFFLDYLEEVIKNRKRLKTHLNRDISFYAAALKIPVTCWMWLIVSVTKDWLMSNRPEWAILCKTITIIWSPFTYKCLRVLMLLHANYANILIFHSKIFYIPYIFIRLFTSLYIVKR